MPTSVKLNRPSQRWQFTLRTFLIAISIVATIVAGYAQWRSAKYREFAAAEAFRRAGGEVLGYNDRYPERRSAETWPQRCLAVLVPDECRFSAKSVSYDMFGDKLVAHLQHMPDLQSVDLRSTEVTNDGLRSLAGLKRLTLLDLHYTKIGDDGLQNLRQLRNLEVVYLDLVPITDQSLPWLASNRNLKILVLNETRVTDKGVAELVGLPKLEELGLLKTRITAQSIATLKTLPKLTSLNVCLTSLDDSAVPALCDLKQLQHLDVRETKISAGGLETLRKTLPKCKIQGGKFR